MFTLAGKKIKFSVYRNKKITCQLKKVAGYLIKNSNKKRIVILFF